MTAWREVALEEVAASGRYSVVGGPFGSALGRKDYTGDGVPVIRGAQLGGPGCFSHGDLVYVSEEKADSHLGNLAYPGDVLVTQRGTVGQVGLIPDDAPFDRYLLSQSQMKLTVNPARANARFVYYWLRSPEAQHAMVGSTISAGVPHINLATFKGIKLPLPSLKEQRAIAGVLHSIDDLIENNRRRVEVLEEMARAIYREWFVRFRYPGHEDVPLVDSPLGPIPEGWVVRSLGELSINHDRRRRPLSKAQRAERHGSFPYYGAAKLIDWVDGWIFDGEHLLFAEDGTVQTVDGFPVLQLVEGKFWANNHTHILEGRDVSTRFLFLACAVQPISGYVTGAAQPKITQANLNRLALVVATPDLQCRFDAVVDPIFDEWRSLQRSSNRARLTPRPPPPEAGDGADRCVAPRS